jgi:hypothetical protein
MRHMWSAPLRNVSGRVVVGAVGVESAVFELSGVFVRSMLSNSALLTDAYLALRASSGAANRER